MIIRSFYRVVNVLKDTLNGHGTVLQHALESLEIYPTKMKRKQMVFFSFLELDQIFRLLHLYSSVAQSSTSICPKIHLIRSKLESVISLEKSNVTNVSI